MTTFLGNLLALYAGYHAWRRRHEPTWTRDGWIRELDNGDFMIVSWRYQA